MIEPELANELITSFDEHYSTIQSVLEQLSHNSDDDQLNNLFRSVHTIKGNAAMANCDPIVDYTHSLEEAISSMRAHRFEPNATICDVMLMAIDRLRDIHEKYLYDKKFDPIDEVRVAKTFEKMSQASNTEEASELCHELILLFTPGLEETGGKTVVDDIPAILPVTAEGSELDVSNVINHSFLNLDEEQKADLTLLRSLALQTDQQCGFWQGRTDRIIYLALKMAKQSEKQIDTTQLIGAIYGHDIGMAFVPDNILNKGSKLTDHELNILKKHVTWSYGIVSRFARWQAAAEMIKQHHEREDGQGYPNQLMSKDLENGAQIIAILDAYYAMTHMRPDRPHRRSVLRSVSEINACSGTQFNEYWVNVFNEVIRNEVREGNI